MSRAIYMPTCVGGGFLAAGLWDHNGYGMNATSTLLLQVEFRVHVHELGNGFTEYVLGLCTKM